MTSPRSSREFHLDLTESDTVPWDPQPFQTHEHFWNYDIGWWRRGVHNYNINPLTFQAEALLIAIYFKMCVSFKKISFVHIPY